MFPVAHAFHIGSFCPSTRKILNSLNIVFESTNGRRLLCIFNRLFQSFTGRYKKDVWSLVDIFFGHKSVVVF